MKAMFFKDLNIGNVFTCEGTKLFMKVEGNRAVNIDTGQLTNHISPFVEVYQAKLIYFVEDFT